MMQIAIRAGSFPSDDGRHEAAIPLSHPLRDLDGRAGTLRLGPCAAASARRGPRGRWSRHPARVRPDSAGRAVPQDGVREIEVSSFVPPKLLPQLADAEAVVKHALSLPGLTVSALIPNLKGAERGLALGVHEMNFVLSVSEGHNRSNVRRSTAESIEDFRRVTAELHERCKKAGRDPHSLSISIFAVGDPEESKLHQYRELGVERVVLGVGRADCDAKEKVLPFLDRYAKVIAKLA